MQRDQRRLAAIVSADVAGYSRLMEADESGTLAALKRHREELIDPKVRRYGGRVVGTAGDSLLIEFASVVDAVQCAAEVQQGMAERNTGLPAERHMRLRIGINLGDVIVDGADIHGDGVNVAARLEKLAEPGGVCVSGVVHDQVAGKVPYGFVAMGEQSFKNIARPVRVLRLEAAPVSRTPVAESTRPPDKPSIAVLPFTNMSGDPEQEYFSDGITEDIITELSRFKSLHVIARNSSFGYKGQSPKVQDVGRELGARYVVEGSVRKAGNRVRVTAQLVEAETGNHVWAERYDRGLDDIFAVQDEVVRAIVGQLPARLDQAAFERTRRAPSENLTAYDLILRARWNIWRTVEDRGKILEDLKRAIALEPNLAEAHGLIAGYYAYGVFALGLSPEDAVPKARYHVERALALGELDPIIHFNAATAYILSGDHDRARIHAERAVEMNPNSLLSTAAMSLVLGYTGEGRAAIELWNELQRRDPAGPDDNRWESMFDTHYNLGEFERAIEAVRHLSAPPPHMHGEAAAAYAQLGRMDEARAEAARCRSGYPEGFDFGAMFRAHAGMCKHPEDTQRWLEGYRKAGFDV
ncbi:MAG: adenylate/guanylate cyclase domain-containing protein [Alphaproteobacteria bacterium]